MVEGMIFGMTKDILDLIEPIGEEKGTNEIMDVVNSDTLQACSVLVGDCDE